jgi:hypothetical protein
MERKTKYLVMSNKDSLESEWEAAVQETLGICHTLSRAYEIALFLAGITAPKIKYRKALETMKAKGAVRITSEKEHEPGAVIVKVKIY